jgi:hypothetical protein
MSVNLGFANLLGLLIILAGVVGLIVGRRYSSNRNSTNMRDKN